MASVRTPGTPASKIERTPVCTPGGTPGGTRMREEKIFVTVRVRPLNRKEQLAKDQSVWDCVDEQTVVYKGQDKSSAPSSYKFDKVFGPSSLTETVYEEGAKDVALSALTGINATIFAYGQTSSGKTYTMRGVTDCAVSDIYRRITNMPEREFTIKISAIEIYNEIVRDLLVPDSEPLRILDDPEKGTIVEKLEEQTAKDSMHLREIISKCEAQRQVGETALNDTSSRSHQIIRLTVISRLRENSGCVKSFEAALNFVDLAGSERAAQTHAKGNRLKEGCHINRSLLTLTTVIRKLSEKKRSGHVPYRDSKLTRILQLSLGGNARTAIICTMSPSLSNVELSRSTLFFAMQAKEVTNTAQVNMVISDKQLVKHLQKEVARLEAELRTPESSSEALLMAKERRIKQMEEELATLKTERDLAKSELDELRKKMGGDNPKNWNPFDSSASPHKVAKCLTFSFSGPGSSKRNPNPLRQSAAGPVMLVQEIRKLEQQQNQLGEEANRALEMLQKEVMCHRQGNQNAAETIAKLQAEIREMQSNKNIISSEPASSLAPAGGPTNLKDEITRLHSQGTSIADLEAQLENVQRSIDRLVMALPDVEAQTGQVMTPSSKTPPSGKKKKILALSSSMNRPHLLRAPCSPLSSTRDAVSTHTGEPDENSFPVTNDKSTPSKTTNDDSTPGNTPSKSETTAGGGTPGSGGGYRRSSSVNMRKMQKMFQNAAEENVRSIRAYVTELKERVAKLQYQKQLLVCQVLELESTAPNSSESTEDSSPQTIQPSPDSWREIFNSQMQQIFLLWDECHVSIIHRTQFYLLFHGDPADQIYVEVELRRLSWMRQQFAEGEEAAGGDDSAVSLSSSIRALRSEREFLAKRMGSRLTEEEKERLFTKYQIPIDGKQRKLQFVHKLWTDPMDRVHIDQSADIVARLVGFCEGNNNVAKEMFELNFAAPSRKPAWLLPISNLLRL